MKEQKEGDLFQDLPVEARAQALKDHAYKSEEMTINRPYTPEQLNQFKDDLSSEMIALNEHEVALKKIKDEYKAKMKPYELKKRTLLKSLKAKHEESFEEVYLLDDQQKGTMNIYDVEGKFIQSRKLYPDERQTTILRSLATGTED